MSSCELPKIIDKTQADIDEVISAIQSCNLPSSAKDFAISCINVAIWFPKALLEQKIKLSNIRKLVFGRGKLGLMMNT
jgi:hypothetical protein